MMLRFFLGAAFIAFTACSSGASESQVAVTAAPAAPKAATPQASLPTVPKAEPPTGMHDPAIAPLLARLTYKSDPYATQPGCISEPKSQLRQDFMLWAQLSLARGADKQLALNGLTYTVTTAESLPREEAPESLGIPRLELVHADGHTTHSDFEGAYREPRSQQIQRSQDATPSDPTWVLSWLARAPISASVVAHRIVLDGRVLREVKKPDDPPRLSSIECDDTSAAGVKLSWHASAKDEHVPLLIDVMRYEGGRFSELLPSTDARGVQGFTLMPDDTRAADKDLVLLVALTDTFRFVTRGVLVPRKAL